MTLHDHTLTAAAKRAAMDEIVVDHPRLKEAHSVFDFLVEHGRLRDRKGKRCVPLIAPSQAGKSTIIAAYAEKKNTPEMLEAGRIPVLHVTLQANMTRRQLAQDILEELGEYGYNTLSGYGTETVLIRRVVEYLKKAKVELLVLDEFQHLVHSDNKHVINSVSEAVKRLLIKGSCPMVMSGVRDAWKPFETNAQLAQRSEAKIDLSPLRVTDPGDMALFIEFLGEYAINMGDLGITRNSTYLLEGDVPSCILEVSRGILGRAVNLVKEAVQLAARSGRNNLTRDDFIVATQRSFIEMKLYDRNPFVSGFAPIRTEVEEDHVGARDLLV